MNASEPQSKLPVIKFNEKNSNPGTSSWKSTSDSVRRALESYGCFVLVDEEFDLKLHESTFSLISEELFNLSIETKKKHTSELPGFGYGGNYSVMPLFEYFGIEDRGTRDAVERFTTLMWPHGHHKFCETMYSYCELLSKLDHTVMRMVTSSYGLEKYYEPLIKSSFYMTRLMKYHSPGENKSNIGIIPHKDKSFLSVIGTNEVNGLEIETPDGEWIHFHPSPSKFIVIVGEAFTAWSNGRIYSPLHKVIARGIKEKYSIGVFSFVRGVLQVPHELVDDENPLKFKPFSNLEFLEYCKIGGPTMNGAIHTYCGI
ncbi:hypothetical protein RD792_015166 [Penstemon davidsonii]|uniref:Fe2OG dioxygenase domain-containing protein n=1 Tax=Penstemon davidsonii TaxID=160366 RepID=A0ABR0CS97_9LAMI|nr:hypothetical protein RD792_015166 [Penstemon davidsonii]